MELGKLDIYKLSVILSEQVWEVYISLSTDLRYSIGNQVLRSVDSIGANIAEGYGRFHYRDSLKFYYNSRGSLWESKHWTYLLYKRKLITKCNYENFIDCLEQLGKKLNSFINGMKKRNDK
ncbi:four helix bundle protein [Francisella philomiragia]|uniref:four helix bundle protein n=1 Tax=Francisella philomiragia TaxID=28110 RepID=UPI0019062601|nr:four helix bundle protein [Francisella philomiragia]